LQTGREEKASHSVRSCNRPASPVPRRTASFTCWIEEGIVEKNEKSGRYASAGKYPNCAGAAIPIATADRSRALSPPVFRTSSAIRCFLTVRTGLDTLCVARRIGSYPIQVLSIEVGARRPLGVSSAGIAILAALPAPEARRIVSDNEVRFTGYRTTAALALDQIAVTRKRGYCLHHTGLVHGTRAISTTIRAFDGQPAAAITIAAVRSRLGPRREDEVVEVLKRASMAIEETLRREAAGHA
jgi:DNA-binding IclR family transcriptional regulator